jgi:excisionase family DNA binding protein
MNEELTAAQVAERLEVGRSTVNLWCRQGKFPGARVEESPVGDYWLIPASDLKDFQPPKRGRVPKSLPTPQKPATRAAGASNGGVTGKKKGGKK